MRRINIGFFRKSETLWVIFGSISTFFLQFGMIKLLTASGEDNYGIYILIISVITLINGAYFGAFEQGFNRYFHTYNRTSEKSSFNGFFFAYFRFNFLLFAVIGVILFLAFHSFTSWNWYIIFVAILFVYANLHRQPAISMLSNVRARKEYYLNQIAYYAVIIIVLYFITTKSDILPGFMLTGFGIGIITCFVALFILKNRYMKMERISVFDGFKRYRDLISYSLPFVIFGLVGWVQSYGERWLVAGTLSLADVGIYGLMASIANAGTTLIYNISTTYFTPILYQTMSNNDLFFEQKKEKVIFLFRLYFGVSIVLFLLFIAMLSIFNEFIISILSSDAFLKHAGYLGAIAASYALFYTGQMLILKGMVLQTSKIYIPAKVVPGVLLILIGYPMIHYFQLPGLIGTLLVINTVYIGLIFIANRKLDFEETLKVDDRSSKA